MSQVTLLKQDGPASAAGTALASQTPVETGTWTEVPAVTAVIPTGGALLRVVANSAPIRVAVMPPSLTAVIPPHNGTPLALGATYTEAIAPGSRVWTRTL